MFTNIELYLCTGSTKIIYLFCVAKQNRTIQFIGVGNRRPCMLCVCVKHFRKLLLKVDTSFLIFANSLVFSFFLQFQARTDSFPCLRLTVHKANTMAILLSSSCHSLALTQYTILSTLPLASRYLSCGYFEFSSIKRGGTGVAVRIVIGIYVFAFVLHMVFIYASMYVYDVFDR